MKIEKRLDWRRLHGLLLDPAAVSFATVGLNQRWATDRYVLVHLEAAHAAILDGVADETSYQLTTDGPVHNPAGSHMTAESLRVRLADWGTSVWWPVKDRRLCVGGPAGTYRVLVRQGDSRPLFIRHDLLFRWESLLCGDRDRLTFDHLRDGGPAHPVRVSRWHNVGPGLADVSRTVGYIMPVRLATPPALPGLVGWPQGC